MLFTSTDDKRVRHLFRIRAVVANVIFITLVWTYPILIEHRLRQDMEKTTPKQKDIVRPSKQENVKPTTNLGKYKPIPRVGVCTQC